MQHWLSVSILLLASPALAGGSPLVGTWCFSETGETLYLEMEGIGFNEHTFCTALSPPTGNAYHTMISCKNSYVSKGETVEAFHEELAFAAAMTSDANLQVTLRDDPRARVFVRCDL